MQSRNLFSGFRSFTQEAPAPPQREFRVDTARTSGENGDKMYLTGDYKNALRHYEEGLKTLDLVPDTNEKKQDVMISLLWGLSAVLAKCSEWDRVVEICTKILSLSNRFVGALVRWVRELYITNSLKHSNTTTGTKR